QLSVTPTGPTDFTTPQINLPDDSPPFISSATLSFRDPPLTQSSPQAQPVPFLTLQGHSYGEATDDYIVTFQVGEQDADGKVVGGTDYSFPATYISSQQLA